MSVGRTAAAALALLLALAGCTRPLAEGERALAEALFGETLDPEQVRVARDFGLAPLPERAPPAPPGRISLATCDRDRPVPVTGPPAAFVLFNRIHFTKPHYASDVLLDWPAERRPRRTLMLAHELAHVWQWQNRDVTGYGPVSAALESFRSSDPYFYRLETARPFLSFGYEQQASLIQDFVCYTLLDSDDPRRARLAAVLAPVLPVGRFQAALDTPG